jgi:AcrR family transcriptional regulator
MPALPSCKSKIFETATRLFYSRGIKSTGVDLIISEAGVNRTTFFKHFPSKQDLVVEYLNTRDKQWMSWLTTRIAEIGPTPRCRLMAIFQALEEWFQTPDYCGCAFTNTLAEFRDEDSPEYRIAISHKKALRKEIKELATAAGASQPSHCADQLMLLIEGAIVRAQLEGRPAAAADARMMAEMVLDKNLPAMATQRRSSKR